MMCEEEEAELSWTIISLNGSFEITTSPFNVALKGVRPSDGPLELRLEHRGGMQLYC